MHPSVAPEPTILFDQATFDEAVAALMQRDGAVLARLQLDQLAPTLRRREAGFEGLASIIVAQQVSTASANAIFGRLKARLGGVEAAVLQTTDDADLKLCGLSAQKLRTLRTIAAAVLSGALDLASLATKDAEAAHQSLVAIKGIGPWTADVFLLFCLGHADAWPAGDLALQEATRLTLELPKRPNTRELIAIGERWRPLRGVAAHCLWAYYGATRRLAALDDGSKADRVAGPPSPPARTVPRRAAKRRNA